MIAKTSTNKIHWGVHGISAVIVVILGIISYEGLHSSDNVEIDERYTYSNLAYGISIMFPSDSVVDPGGSRYDSFVTFENEKIQNLSVFEDLQEHQSFQDLLDSTYELDEDRNSPPSIDPEVFMIDGRDSVLYEGLLGHTDRSGTRYVAQNYLYIYDSKDLIFKLSVDDSVTKEDLRSAISFNKVDYWSQLFIAHDWDTYIAKDFDFSFRHPKYLTVTEGVDENDNATFTISYEWANEIIVIITLREIITSNDEGIDGYRSFQGSHLARYANERGDDQVPYHTEVVHDWGLGEVGRERNLEFDFVTTPSESYLTTTNKRILDSVVFHHDQ